MAGRRQTEAHGIDAVTDVLERRGVAFDVVEHDPTYGAAAGPRPLAADPEATAKTVVLHDHDGYRLAVVPASERLDVRRARDLLGASHHLRLPNQQERSGEFPAFEGGARPAL